MTKQSPPIAIAIHGGAGTIVREQMSAELQSEIEQALSDAVQAGYKVLADGGDALDASVEAVKVLENCPHFNAGHGSVLTHDEMVEMDASVMHGRQRDAGAVAGVKYVANPIMLARDVMLHSPHVMLLGEGAQAFAKTLDYPFVEQDYFFTERRYEQLQSMKEKGLFALSESRYPDDKKYGTVGAVALDMDGNLAAATSTGGVTNKKFGRVGDTAIIGAGTFAENSTVAVSTTGMGEYFIRQTVASDVAARMRYLGEPMSVSCDTIIHGELKEMGGEGGLIAMDSQGQHHFSMNSSGMYRAAITPSGDLEVSIYAK